LGGRVLYLDGIKIASSIVVCTAHSVQIFILPKFGAKSLIYFIMSQAASYAVIIFFMLSGFMVTNSILSNKLRYGFFNFKKYWKDRLLRLYPPLILAILISFFMYLVINFFHLHGSISYRLPNDMDLAREFVQYSGSELLQSLFFIQGFINCPMQMNGPLWSLGDEFFLYLIASFLSLAIINGLKFIPILCISILFGIVLYSRHLDFSAYLYLMWFIGAYFSLLKHKTINSLTRRKEVCIVYLLVLILLAVLLSASFRVTPVDYQFSTGTIVQFCLLLFIVFLFRTSSAHVKNQVKSFISKITPKRDFTFTLYVIHFPILLFCFSLMHKPLSERHSVYTFLCIVLLLPLIIWVASLFARYVEDKQRILTWLQSLKNMNLMSFTNK
jgi:peptidoglycan/LPS O-acetylase OafA/YrhL